MTHLGEVDAEATGAGARVSAVCPTGCRNRHNWHSPL